MAKIIRTLVLTGLLGLMNSCPVFAALTDRVPNTTLRLPASPPTYGYTTENAFGNLSFTSPVAIVSPPDETNRLFIVEQGGRIAVITNLAAPTRTVFLDISSRVQYRIGEEEGLLGLAFHPDYSINRYFYVFYTTPSTRYNRVARFEVDPGNPNRALANSEQILINQFDEAPNHNGGDLQFGRDGYLYVSLGDEGGGGDTYQNGQRIDKDFFSGILRIDVDKRPSSILPNPHPANTNNAQATFNYAIPADNPFVGATSFNGRPVESAKVRTEFWAVGLRNPWRMSFDPVTGFLYCGDVGQSSREEVDVIIKGGNYGWADSEGSYRPSPGAPVIPAVPFIQEYTRGSGANQGTCVTGGLVYRGAKYSELYGDYIFGDYVSGNIWKMRYEIENGVTNITPFSRIAVDVYISAFGTDPSNGDILLADQSEHTIKRLVRASSSGTQFPPTLADVGAFSNLQDLSPHAGIVPYSINVPFWSDYAHKTRWFSVPNINLYLGFDPVGAWSFPTGTVWIKHFDLELTNGVPASARRLETRFLVRHPGGVYGLTYRWGNQQANATLVAEEGMDESFVINDGGILRTQVWHYPGRTECLRCHTPQGGFAAGFNTRQLNRESADPADQRNQLTALSQAGYFDTPIPEPQTLTALVHPTDVSAPLETRVRSYLDANCVQCHQPGGGAQGFWDARIDTPLNDAGIINGPLMDYLGDVNNRVVLPGSLSKSVLYTRIASMGAAHMPPLATSELNREAMALLSRWITNDLVGANSPPVANTDTIQRYLFSGTKVLISALLANDSDANGDELSFAAVASISTGGAAVSRQGEWIHYTPPAGFTNNDSFTYQITDNRGEPVTGIVNVVASTDPPSPNLSVTDLGNGSYRIRFDGVPGLTYRIEYTPALNPPQWQTLGSRTADPNGMFEIMDTPPPGFGQRFYRSVYP